MKNQSYEQNQVPRLPHHIHTPRPQRLRLIPHHTHILLHLPRHIRILLHRQRSQSHPGQGDLVLHQVLLPSSQTSCFVFLTLRRQIFRSSQHAGPS
jgi:hypothetical protein